MPIILRLQSAFESQLQDLGPPEAVSILAELLVAACVFGPVVAVMAMTSWLLKRRALHRSPSLAHGATVLRRHA